MSITFDSSVAEVNYSGSPVSEVVWNNTSVWSSFTAEIILSETSSESFGLDTDNATVRYRMEFPIGEHDLPKNNTAYQFRLKQTHDMTEFGYDNLSILLKLQDGTYASSMYPPVGSSFINSIVDGVYLDVAPAEVGEPALLTYSTDVFVEGAFIRLSGNPIVSAVVVGALGGSKNSEHTSTTISLDIANYGVTW